jgi:CheY-like chemotaxis protein
LNQPASNSASDRPPEKKRLLLVDADAGQSALRVRIMGKVGIKVDCASDTSAARVLWRSNSYQLVLIDLRHDARKAAEFCAEIKTDSPRQEVQFLVGKPGYLSSSQNPELMAEALPLSETGQETTMRPASNGGSAPPVRGGFSEAIWRMSLARRSLNDPRTKKTTAESFGDAVRLAENKERVAP